MSDSRALPPRALPPRGLPPWWYPTRSKLVILSLVLVLIVGVAWGVWRFTHCASGVRRLGGECVGVTDGGFVFWPDLADVLGRIREENRWVEQQGEPFVSIAYLVALPGEGNDQTQSQISRHELQGAYLAQRRANHTSGLGDEPLIRLLVANGGEGNARWQAVVAQLRGRVASADRLVAVAGLGVSSETTRQAIAALTKPENPDAGGIPVIAARLTAEDIGGESGFARMAPTTGDQATVGIAYLKLNPEFRTALLIQDVNIEDTYSQTLGLAFRDTFSDPTHTLLEPVEEYNGSLDGLANRFVQMMSSICQQRPDFVYFAGRGTDLEDFIEALPGRPCPDFLVNLVTGGSAARTAIVLAGGDEALKDGLESGVTLTYTAQAHPGSWAPGAAPPNSFSPGAIERFLRGCEGPDCFTRLFPDESLDDAAAIMGHDAVVAAVRAIRSAAVGQDLRTDPISPEEVGDALNGLHGDFAVPGASGWISLDERGDPVNKAIPILELHPDGTVEFLALSAAPFIPPGSSVLGTQS
ncbi:MAG: ABC transporter substrate-binding protein [Egibacteraceae bacterium]